MTIRHLLISRLIWNTRRLLRNAILRSRTKSVYLRRRWIQVWWQLLFIKVATYVITFSVARYQFSRRLTFRIVSLRFWSSVRKPIFGVLPFLLAVSSLIHLNVFSSWINGKFTGLSTSIFKEFSTFSILGEVILRDSSHFTISDSMMQLI